MKDRWRDDVEFFGVADDGTKTTLTAKGLRIVLDADTWVAIDFERPSDAVTVVNVAARSSIPRPHGGLPRLSMVPRAGGSVAVEFESHLGPPAEVWTVSHAELEGEVEDLLQQSRSGDILGEFLLPEHRATRISQRRFRLHHSQDGWVDIDLAHREGFPVVLGLQIGTNAQPSAENTLSVLDMLIHVHACNLVSMWFRKTEGVILR